MKKVPVDSESPVTRVETDANRNRFEFDANSTAPSLAAATALAVVEGLDPTEIEPLYPTVDSDALDGMLGRDAVDRPVHVTWTHDGYTVTVGSQGAVTITAADDRSVDDDA